MIPSYRLLRHASALLIAVSAFGCFHAPRLHAESVRDLRALAMEVSAQPSGPHRIQKMEVFLDAFEAASLSMDQRFQIAWAACILADNIAERSRLIALAAKLADVRARMLLGSFREFPDLAKTHAAAERAQGALIAKPDSSGKKQSPKDLYGVNSYDAPYAFDTWKDPYGFVGRWQGGTLTLDVIAYPADTFIGQLRSSARGGSPVKLLGLRTESKLELVGPGVRGTLQGGRLQLTFDHAPHVLARVPVGVTYFEKRPAEARVLLDAKSGLQAFRHAKGDAEWTLHPDGAIEIVPSKGSLFTKDTFADLQGYLEFRHAYNSESVWPRRGNSGVYLYNTYEVQLIDSYGFPPNDTSEGSIYHIAAPKVTASAPPLEWQSLEFKFKAPRFDRQGNKTANARLTLWFNGIKIHDDLEIPNPTAGSAAGGRALKDPLPPQPLMLQNHGGILQFRNLWVLPLAPSS